MIPDVTAWTEYEPAVDETTFTPWAEQGWLAHNGQSPEVAVCDFARTLIRMMQPALVLETGVGQGYMTRTVAMALRGLGQLVAFESDDQWREHIAAQQFWFDYQQVASLSPHHTPPAEMFAVADLSIIDSEFEVRFDEIVLWELWAKPGAVALIHDTADRDDTIHQSLRGLCVELGMTGVFLQNPRGCFMAVQRKEK